MEIPLSQSSCLQFTTNNAKTSRGWKGILRHQPALARHVTYVTADRFSTFLQMGCVCGWQTLAMLARPLPGLIDSL